MWPDYCITDICVLMHVLWYYLYLCINACGIFYTCQRVIINAILSAYYYLQCSWSYVSVVLNKALCFAPYTSVDYLRGINLFIKFKESILG